ncbi:hypothetical protein D3C75_685620 [compost metagenome]
MKCLECRTEELHESKEINVGRCNKCIEKSNICTECEKPVDPNAVFIVTGVGRGHKSCLEARLIGQKGSIARNIEIIGADVKEDGRVSVQISDGQGIELNTDLSLISHAPFVFPKVLKHECQQKKDIGSFTEDIEYNNNEKLWELNIDCHCCSTEIVFCPYCGEKLNAPQ